MRRLLPFLLAATCGAAEVARRDLMLAAETGDGAFDYTLGSRIGDLSGSDAFDRIGVARLGGRWAWATAGSPLAPLFGADAEWLDAPLQSGGMQGYGLSLTAGGTWAISEALAIDGEGVLGLMQAALQLPGSGGTAPLEADGTLLRQGLRLRLLWHATSHLSVGLEGGWMAWGGGLGTSDGRSLDLDGSGPVVGLALAWRPSARPGGIE